MTHKETLTPSRRAVVEILARELDTYSGPLPAVGDTTEERLYRHNIAMLSQIQLEARR